MGKKISDQVAATSRNDAAPILSVFLELVPLEGIYLVADDAGHGHEYPPGDHQKCMFGSMPVVRQEQFVYHRSMNVAQPADGRVSRIAAAIGEPARARML